MALFLSHRHGNSLTADPVKVEYDAESGTATFEVTFYNKQKRISKVRPAFTCEILISR